MIYKEKYYLIFRGLVIWYQMLVTLLVTFIFEEVKLLALHWKPWKVEKAFPTVQKRLVRFDYN